MSLSAAQQIRRRMRGQRQSMSGGEWEERSALIRNRLCASEPYKSCRRLFAFMGFNREPDTAGIIDHAIYAGKEVALPRCIDEQEMKFFLIESAEDLEEGRYGILEPKDCDGLHLAVPTDGDLMLLPGLAFDSCGNRIGYGKGYYDRYLNRTGTGVKTVMLAFDFQEETAIEPNKTDVPVDMIVTDQRLITIRR